MADVPESQEERGDYRSYLLRLWREGDGEQAVWRAWLKSARTGRQIGFSHLEELCDFVRRQAAMAPNDASRKTDAPQS